LKIRDFLRLDYESQIRLSLVCFIVLLVLFNFGTEYLFHQTKEALVRQIRQQLSSTAHSASLVWEGHSRSNLRTNLAELSFESGVNRISFLSSDGEPLISSRDGRSIQDLHIFHGVKPKQVSLFRTEAGRQKPVKFFSDFYQDSSGCFYLSCYLPLQTSSTQNPIWVMVEKDVSGFAKIERVSRLNVLARIAGILIAAIVTVLLIRNLLYPYRRMVKKARKEMIIPAWEETKKEGELDLAVGVFEQVIRELKEKEKALQKLCKETDRRARELASYNEYILKSMTNGMILCDDEGKITRMNQPAERMLGLTQEQVLGKQYEAVFGEASPLRSALGAVPDEGKTCFIPEIELRKRNGASIPLSISSSVVKDDQGKTLGVVLFLADLTELKKLEEQVAFRDKMASLGEMSSGLAHELRNSMGTILGFSKLLKKRREDPVSCNLATDGIVNEAMSMESMLQRFLSFTKPLQLEVEKVDLKDIIEECYTPITETLREQNIDFNLESETKPAPTAGDRLLLKQCFQNLIQNSIEAMPNGGELSIQIDERRLASDETWVVVEISDTGCGIVREDQDKIFNPFFTLREKGTGLGLSLVKKIVTLHDGRIELDSEPNKGTTFRVYLPLKLVTNLTQADSQGKNDTETLVYNHSTNINDNSEDI
jgi:PAS domain S-box-containing protein